MSTGDEQPPGWYRDPVDPDRERWWAGRGWSDDTRTPPSEELRRPDEATADAVATIRRPQTEPDQPGVALPPPGLAPGRGRPGGPLAIATVALLVAVLGIGVLVVVVLIGGTDPTPATTTNGPSTTNVPSTTRGTSTTVPSTTIAPPTTTAPTTSLPVAVPRAARVARTCGSSGGGDCFLSVRAAPTTSSAELARLPEGSETSVVCQVVGARVTSSVLGRSTDVWARDELGRFLSAAFLGVDGWSPYEVTSPCP